MNSRRAAVASAIAGTMVRTSLLLLLAVLGPVMSGAGAAPPALAEWSNVLRTFVNEQGQVNFAALARDREGLERVVAEIGRISPASAPAQFPTEESKLAYYVNAYNALAMYNVIDSGIPHALNWWRRIKFFGLKRFSLGGEEMSLYTLENKVIRPIGDERIHFALNCMVAGCPRLPREPFAAGKLDEQLDAATGLFFSEPRNLSIDRAAKVVWVSSILEFYTEDFLQKAPTLIAYINRYGGNSIPADYAVQFIPYDWTINRQ